MIGDLPQNNTQSDAEKARAIIEESAERRELDQLLKEFNFSLLKSLIEERVRSIGIRDINLTPAEEIFSFKSNTALGDHNSNNGQIGINISLLRKYTENIVLRKIMFIRVLIHEQVHAVSTSEISSRVGFSSTDFGPIKITSFRLWNEGVTEKLARELMKQYMYSNGNSGEKVPVFLGSYDIPVEFVEFFIKKIAEGTEFDKQTIWNAILKAFFIEGTITDEDLEGIFPSGFYQELEFSDKGDLIMGIDPIAERAMQKNKFSQKIDFSMLEIRRGAIFTQAFYKIREKILSML